MRKAREPSKRTRSGPPGKRTTASSRPSAAATATAEVPDEFESSEAFATRLLESGLVVSPGSFFGPAGEGYFRIALVPAEGECRRAAELLRETL